MPMIDATKWDEFYQEMTKDLKPYDHYDDGYRDAMDNVDDWMDGNQVEAEPVRHGCPYCCDNGEGGHGMLKYSYDDDDGMAMSIHPSEKRKDGTRSLAWWATVHFRGECRDFYVEACPFCGRRLVPFTEEYDNASHNCGAKMYGGHSNEC